jgi:flagellar protein FliL
MAVNRTLGQPTKIVGTPAPVGAARKVAPTQAEEQPVRGKRRGLLVGLAVLVVALVAAAAFLVLRPTAEAVAVDEPPALGAVVPVEAISINLADGRYLRMGFGLQLSAESEGEIETARALDVAIATFSGRDVAEVNDPASRAQLKTELLRQLSETFDGEVVDVYFTEFVTQ